ncbi:MAG: PilZ domain-containing protein [Desulfobacterales bacterium]
MRPFTRRGFLRQYRNAPIHFQNTDTRELHEATMCDCSRKGMQFISDCYLQPGLPILISRIPAGVGGGSACSLRARKAVVRWCNGCETGSFSTGVQFTKRKKPPGQY